MTDGKAELRRHVLELLAERGRTGVAVERRAAALADAVVDAGEFLSFAAGLREAEATFLRVEAAAHQRAARKAAVALGLMPRARWRRPRLIRDRVTGYGVDADLLALLVNFHGRAWTRLPGAAPTASPEFVR